MVMEDPGMPDDKLPQKDLIIEQVLQCYGQPWTDEILRDRHSEFLREFARLGGVAGLRRCLERESIHRCGCQR